MILTNDTSKERSDTQLFGAGKSEGVALPNAPCSLAAKRHWKKSKFNGAKSGRKKKNLIAPIWYLYYELSVCPLLLKYNKVYLASSLIAKPNVHTTY